MTAATIVQANSGLLTAAFSTIMGIPLSTDVASSDQPEMVSVFDHHKTTYSYGCVGNRSATTTDDDRCLLFIKTLKNGTFQTDVKANAKIEEIKAHLHELLGVPPDEQRLIYNGKQLEDGSFGSETIIFQKTIANEFEERLSEMIHQRSIQCFTGKNEHNGSLLASEPSAPMVSRNIIDIEMETEKKYAYQPLPSVA
ncbi:unnamed protein product [Adineta steineri]|uniref:Ubiquitin-like domain-containing protein n=1 Tax=Adineta steineri TaxID=433720 RepID=A0A815M3H4_9BILA|nr:unnamed protein product [Adineta steineri]